MSAVQRRPLPESQTRAHSGQFWERKLQMLGRFSFLFRGEGGERERENTPLSKGPTWHVVPITCQKYLPQRINNTNQNDVLTTQQLDVSICAPPHKHPYIHTHAPKHTYTHTHTPKHPYTHTHTRTHTRTHTHTHKRTYSQPAGTGSAAPGRTPAPGDGWH